MDDRTGSHSEMGFTESDSLLSGLSGDLIGRILFKSSDVVLVVDGTGVIRDASFLSGELFEGGGKGWKGRPLLEIVTAESIDKVNELLSAAGQDNVKQARQVNHPIPNADDLPVSYQAAKLNDNGDVVLFGRNDGQVANLQRRLMSSQLAMEREVAKLRNFENRYRAAFQLSQLPIVMVDATSLRILDINSSASSLLGKAYVNLENERILNLFDDEGSTILHKLLLAAVDNQTKTDAFIRLNSGEMVNIRIVTFRQDGNTLLLLSFSSTGDSSAIINDTVDSKVLSLIKGMPDAFVATSADLKVITANKAFYDLLAHSNSNEVNGIIFDRFFERPTVDYKVLIANVKEYGVVGRFASTLKTKFSQPINVEIAACQIEVAGEAILGFWIRPTSSFVKGVDAKEESVTRSNEQIANLVGHMPLKDIVRDTTEMIEALCIETALELTKNNRASAAQMLGVSRQSLYTKLGNDKGK